MSSSLATHVVGSAAPSAFAHAVEPVASPHRRPSRGDRLWQLAHAPYDVAGLVALRLALGALAVIIPLRCLAYGWVDRFYVTPTFYFPYWGLEFVRTLPAPFIHLVFVAMAVAGLGILVGAFYRVCSALFFVLFTYIELIDVTTYLNHYYLLSLLAFWAAVLPLHRAYSVDAARRPALRASTLPAWMTWVFRFQVGVVYVFAAHAKLTSDWLVYGQPMALWLGARLDTPLLGPIFRWSWMPLFMSWAGFLYDATIPLWLSWRVTRPLAYLAVIAFHVTTYALFDIGLFPWIMTLVTPVFFAPDWPRRLLRRSLPETAPETLPDTAPTPPFSGRARLATIAMVAFALFQLVFPLRAYAYGGNVLWHEQGMRWSWRVLCRDKTASVTFRVRAAGWSHEREIPPRRFLTFDQEFEFAGQPDMILRLAHHIHDVYVARGERDVEVRVDAYASLNGRRRARLIDPEVDLARVEDTLLPVSWISPAPTEPPPSRNP